jgi:hypothetical protein
VTAEGALCEETRTHARADRDEHVAVVGRSRSPPAGARLLSLARVEADEVPCWVNVADAVVVPSMAERVREAWTELIDPALYSRAKAPTGAVCT